MPQQNTGEMLKKRGGVQNLTNMGKGRKKGVQNKFTTLKDAFLYAFEKIGGKQGLAEWAKNPKNRGAFYTTISKMLPNKTDVEVIGSQGGEIEMSSLEVAARIATILELAARRRRLAAEQEGLGGKLQGEEPNELLLGHNEALTGE